MQFACDVTISLQLDVLLGMADGVQLMQDGLSSENTEEALPFSAQKTHIGSELLLLYSNLQKLT